MGAHGGASGEAAKFLACVAVGARVGLPDCGPLRFNMFSERFRTCMSVYIKNLNLSEVLSHLSSAPPNDAHSRAGRALLAAGHMLHARPRCLQASTWPPHALPRPVPSVQKALPRRSAQLLLTPPLGPSPSVTFAVVLSLSVKKCTPALAGRLSWSEHRPIHRKVAGSIPVQGTCLGCRFSPQSGHVREATNQCLSHVDVSLPPLSSSLLLPLPLPLKSINIFSVRI